MDALVTGGLGFIGSNLVDFLVGKGWNVSVIDNLSTGSLNYKNPKANYIIKDLMDITQADTKDFDYIFHMAALPRIQPSFDEPELHEMVNVVITIRLLETLKGNTRLKKLVYSASSSCYGTPENYPTTEEEHISILSPYALQKYASEQYCLVLGERFNIPVVTLRYFNAYGPRSFNPENKQNAYSSVVGIFDYQMKQNQPLTITGDGSQKRDFVHVFDIANANYLAAITDVKNDFFNIGYGQSFTILEIAKMFNHPYNFIAKREGEAEITFADISKAKSKLGWSPNIDIFEGIKTYNT